MNRIIEQFGTTSTSESEEKITELIYKGDIRQLNDAVSDYLQEKEAVWVLIDDLDKSWPTRGAASTDILIVRALLEAT